MKVLDKLDNDQPATTNSFQHNPNVEWLQSKGSWMIHIYLVVFCKFLFSIIPGISPEASWTMTNLFYNMATFIVFHWLVGSPFDDQPTMENEHRFNTLWEQIDYGQQFTPTKKFLAAVPIILFLLSTHYSNYDAVTFAINFLSLSVNLIGKLPIMDRVRLFGINKKN